MFGKRWSKIIIALLTAGMSHVTPVFAEGPPGPSDVLRGLKIGLDHASLCKALEDPRPNVRSLAATQLAEDRDKAAIPELKLALDRETATYTAYNLASSLVTLGSAAGQERLNLVCLDTGSPTALRTGSAELLASVAHDFGCSPYMVDLISSPNETAKNEALRYLTRVPASYKTLAAFGPPLLAVATSDPNPTSRDLAARALIQLGDDGSKRAWYKDHPKQP